MKEAKQSNSTERKNRLKTANKKPGTIQVITTSYKRNPDIIAEVLECAKGICEDCSSAAPFLRASDGTPYL